MVVIDHTDGSGATFAEQCTPPYRFKSGVIVGCGRWLRDPGDDWERAKAALYCWREALKRGLPIVSVVHSNYCVDVYVQGF